MRIGYDAKRAFNNTTGLGNYSRFILHKIYILNDKTLEPIAFTPSIKKGIFDEFPNSNVVVPKLNFLKSIWRSFFMIKDINSHQINIYHGLTGEIPFFINRLKIKTLVTIHDLIFLKLPKNYSYIDVLIYKFKFKYACKNADKVIAISQNTKNDIIEFFNIAENKVEVIYQSINEIYRNQCDTEFKNLILSKYGINKPYFLSVGTLEPRKNQLNIIKAFERLNNDNLELILVGRGKKYRELLLDYINKNNIKNVKILSNVETQDLPAIYQSSIALIYISLYEGFGIPIVEALACKVPIIAAKGSCLEEAGGSGAIYIDPYNLEEIKNSIIEVSKDNNLRNMLISEGQKHLKKFEPNVLTNQLIDIYKELNNTSK